MSRRDSHHSKHFSSKPGREPSPKRSRGERKSSTERLFSSHALESADPSPQQKHRRHLQDALPLEAPAARESKPETDAVNEGLDNKVDGQLNGIKRASDPSKVPRSRSFFQHDERGSAGQGGQSFNRRATERGRWSNTKERSGDRMEDKVTVHDTQKRDERILARADDNSVWRHDGFYELQADAPPPSRKRPAFREKKLSPEPENVAGATETVKASHLDRPTVVGAKRDEKGGYHPQGSDKGERQFTETNERRTRAGERITYRGEIRRSGYSSRDRFGNGNSFRGRDRFNGRYGERRQSQQGGFQVEKWKHDLFDEANRSPTPKKEEDQIAKVEALLAL